MLLDPAIPITEIMARLGVKRATVTYELVRMRRAGFQSRSVQLVGSGRREPSPLKTTCGPG